MTEAARLLRYARKRARLSQRALAAKAGVPQPYVARIESSRVDPSVSSLSRLLRACGTTLEAMPGTGEGVDWTIFTIDMTPAERMAQARPMAEWIETVERARATP
jgi:transcriptional regulator with XRE-family HTH domain